MESKKAKTVLITVLMFAVIYLTWCSGCGSKDNESENAEEITQTVGAGEGEGGGKDDGILEVKEFSIVIDENEIIYTGFSYSNIQSLIDQILSEVEEEQRPIVVLHTDNAITDTLEEVKNKLDKNKIEWEEK